MRTTGKLIAWNDARGFGFIAPMAGGKQTFIHATGFSNRKRSPEIGQILTYELAAGKDGRPCAKSAAVMGDRKRHNTTQSHNYSAILAGSFLLFIGGAAVFSQRVPLQVIVLYTVLSLATVVIYAIDKSAAKNGTWRIPESTLHWLSVAGGWPGALIAQQILRHKTRKQPFRSVFWVTVLLNCGALAWFLTPDGAARVESLIGAIML